MFALCFGLIRAIFRVLWLLVFVLFLIPGRLLRAHRPPKLVYSYTPFNAALIHHTRSLHKPYIPTMWTPTGSLQVFFSAIWSLVRHLWTSQFTAIVTSSPPTIHAESNGSIDLRWVTRPPAQGKPGVVMLMFPGMVRASSELASVKWFEELLAAGMHVVIPAFHHQSPAAVAQAKENTLTVSLVEQAMDFIHTQYGTDIYFTAVGWSDGAEALVSYAADSDDFVDDKRLLGMVLISHGLAWKAACGTLQHNLLYRLLRQIDAETAPILEEPLSPVSATCTSPVEAELRRNISGVDWDNVLTQQRSRVSKLYRSPQALSAAGLITVPTLLIQSLDDPFIRASMIPTQEIHANTNLIMALTEQGGHSCFLEGTWPLSSSRSPSWAERCTGEFLVACANLMSNHTGDIGFKADEQCSTPTASAMSQSYTSSPLKIPRITSLSSLEGSAPRHTSQ